MMTHAAKRRPKLPSSSGTRPHYATAGLILRQVFVQKTRHSVKTAAVCLKVKPALPHAYIINMAVVSRLPDLQRKPALGLGSR